jgi:hypothetical protein
VTELPNVGLYRRATAAALVLGPLLFLLDNLLHPKEYTRDHEAQQLAKIGDAYTRWQLAHTIGFVALIVFAAAVLGLAFMVRRRQPMFGLVAGALGVVGLLGAAGVFAIDGYTWGVLGEVSTKPGIDHHTVEVALNTVQKSNWSLAWYLLLPVWIAGIVLLAIGVGRHGGVPAWAALLLAVGALTVGTEAFITSNAYFIASSALWAAGGIAVATSIARMSDTAFAGEQT